MNEGGILLKQINANVCIIFFDWVCKRLHKGESMTTTIKDIAKRVGVSPSTVSRVINRTASISEETKEKIYELLIFVCY